MGRRGSPGEWLGFPLHVVESTVRTAIACLMTTIPGGSWYTTTLLTNGTRGSWSVTTFPSGRCDADQTVRRSVIVGQARPRVTSASQSGSALDPANTVRIGPIVQNRTRATRARHPQMAYAASSSWLCDCSSDPRKRSSDGYAYKILTPRLDSLRHSPHYPG